MVVSYSFVCVDPRKKRVEGIEPSSLAWKAIALPLSYTRMAACRRSDFGEHAGDRLETRAKGRRAVGCPAVLQPASAAQGRSAVRDRRQAFRRKTVRHPITPGSGECRIRTCEGKIHQIYSLTPLTARETPRVAGPWGLVSDGCVGGVMRSRPVPMMPRSPGESWLASSLAFVCSSEGLSVVNGRVESRVGAGIRTVDGQTRGITARRVLPAAPVSRHGMLS